MKEALAIMERVLGVPDGSINPNTVISEVEEWDSLAFVQIIGELEETYSIHIPIENLDKIKCVADILQYFGKR